MAKKENLENENEVVEVKKADLAQLVGTVQEQAKQINKLLEIADRGRLAHWESTHKEDSPRVYRLTTYDVDGVDKVILSWRMIKNHVWKDAEGHWKENQVIEVGFADGEKMEMPYVEFITKTQKLSAKLLSTKQTGSQVIFEVEADGGEKYTIDSVFIN